MKKISLFASALALMLCCTFTSCSVEDNAVEGNGLVDPPTKEIEVEEFVAEFTYDFAAAAAAEENPANFNGNQNNGQGFNAYSVKIRNDYKGYKWAEGSVLPDVCHVWRRTDRINGNVKDGGLACPNDREMAIDGLEEGSIVVITYTAEEGNELVWAIGEADADGNAVGAGEGTPVATATINGVEAVSNETIIPSAAQIVMKSITPAKNGTGYLVFKVKKGTVITKIEIGKIETVKKTITM